MSAPNLIRKTVTVADLQHGNTVEINGNLETVSRLHLNRGVNGHTYKGHPHRHGIVKVTFKVQIANGFRYE